jgi:hypothetical protein
MGWIINCTSFFQKLDQLSKGNKYFKPDLVKNGTYHQVIKDLIYAPYNMALLLEELNLHCPELNVDPSSYTNTLYKLMKVIDPDNTFHEKDLIYQGRISVIVESTGGHCDNYNGVNSKHKDIDIESKITLCNGPCQVTKHDLKDEYFCDILLPDGVLCYPLYGSFTNCAPIMDIECHLLQNTVHLSTRASEKGTRTSTNYEYIGQQCKQSSYKDGTAITYIP